MLPKCPPPHPRLGGAQTWSKSRDLLCSVTLLPTTKGHHFILSSVYYPLHFLSLSPFSSLISLPSIFIQPFPISPPPSFSFLQSLFSPSSLSTLPSFLLPLYSLSVFIPSPTSFPQSLFSLSPFLPTLFIPSPPSFLLSLSPLLLPSSSLHSLSSSLPFLSIPSPSSFFQSLFPLLLPPFFSHLSSVNL